MAWHGVLFGLALGQACALVLAAMHLGRHFRILDYPDKERKLHARATPRTGGLALCLALVLTVAEGALAGAVGHSGDNASVRWVAALLVSTGLLCALGLWDDKWGMRARTKLCWQIAAILPFVCWGRPEATADLFGWHLDLAWLTIPLVLLWLVSCTKFVNLIDGLDGLAGTVGVIVSATVAALAWLNQLSDVFAVAVILTGVLAGFLVHNWPPARIFMGDSGSLPLGFLVGALSLEASAKKAAGLTLAVPFVLLAVPMLDTSMAILRRKLTGLKIGQGDRQHIHHCLRDRGLSPTQTLLAIGAMCLATALAALAATVFSSDWIAAAMALVLVSVLIAGRVFGFNETVLLVRHMRAVLAFVRSVPRLLRTRFAVVRSETTLAAGRLDLWDKIVNRARRVNALEVEFVCEHARTGMEIATLSWGPDRAAGAHFAEQIAIWNWSCSLPRGDGVVARARARGVLARSSDAWRWNELAALLVALCEHWPVAVNVEGEPRILRPHFPAESRRDARPHAFPDTVESDAA